MQHLQHLGFIELYNYPRQVKLSEAQRPKYWEWDGTTIKCGSRKLLQKYINQDYRENIIMNNGNIDTEWLKESYHIVSYRGNQPWYIYGNDYYDSMDLRIVFTKTNIKKPIKNYLCKVSINKEDRVVNIEKVLANETQAGKPKYHIISGQDDHVRASPFTRKKVVDTLHDYYYDEIFRSHSNIKLNYIRRKFESNYPLYIVLELKDTVKNVFDNSKDDIGRRWDVGNRLLPYNKTFLDFLTRGYKDKNGEVLMRPFIEDDDRLHVTSANNGYFTPIENEENRSIVVHFYKDTRKCFNKYYN